MKKTYRFLNHTEPLPANEIRRLYNGYWVFLVKAEFSEINELLSGIPVIIGVRAHDGASDGIYKKYMADEYAPRADLNLLPRGFISSLRPIGSVNA